ncbi:Right handed beta helix region [Amycolatopsis arida]|uniref:Right handed beta helix region n=1 Tax=Amycolatopsis arida TaxID=587909 RepID=A0A1I5QMA2_9PSEU|nr:right-handed parallel beta-helix repeat-containing protein [Amycolatopsis arida]TDX98890.1 parallel beta helix pectate lyase-like protein [Amycolatopsis arida]SFP47141.1 Right handed beta helix region [Amycolatopsis arida]
MRPHTPVPLTLAVLCAATLAGPAAAAEPAAAGEVVYTVDSTADLPAARRGSGECRTAAGTCTLRAAVQASNVRPGRIALPEGRFVLTVRPNPALAITPIPDASAGNLAVVRPTTITGAGAGRTVVDANGIDRAFTTTANTTISDLTITGGVTRKRELLFITAGGGVLNSARLTLRRVEVRGNRADYGGGIFNLPGSDLTIEDSVVAGNEAGEAGGIRFDWSGTVRGTRIEGNRAVNPHRITHPASLGGRGGGIDLRGPGPLTIVGSTITGNSATDGGAGINAAPAYLDSVAPPNGGFPLSLVVLRDSTVTGNTGSTDCARAFSWFQVSGGDVDRSCRAGTSGAARPG